MVLGIKFGPTLVSHWAQFWQDSQFWPKTTTLNWQRRTFSVFTFFGRAPSLAFASSQLNSLFPFADLEIVGVPLTLLAGPSFAASFLLGANTGEISSFIWKSQTKQIITWQEQVAGMFG